MSQTLGYETARENSAAPVRRGFAPTPQTTFTHEQIVDMEIALELCNSFVAITNRQQDALEQASVSDDARIAELKRLRLQFLHDWPSKITRDNIVWVREFINTYAPELKNYYAHGVLPKIIADV